MYFFWDEDTGAFANETASVFTGGQMAMAGAGGILLGMLGATLFLLPASQKAYPLQAEVRIPDREDEVMELVRKHVMHFLRSIGIRSV